MRKPEVVTFNTFNVVKYDEVDRVLAQYQAISDEAERIYDAIPG